MMKQLNIKYMVKKLSDMFWKIAALSGQHLGMGKLLCLFQPSWDILYPSWHWGYHKGKLSMGSARLTLKCLMEGWPCLSIFCQIPNLCWNLNLKNYIKGITIFSIAEFLNTLSWQLSNFDRLLAMVYNIFQ